jgi:cytidine deaminase
MDKECYYATHGYLKSQSASCSGGFDGSHRVRNMPKRSSAGQVRSKQLIEAAHAAFQNAYAPYSKFRVGAALLTANGEVFTGCNVENASYGMSNCAERTAIFSAISQGGPKLEIVAIAVANDHQAPCSPCGACRQVIYEFGPKATVFFRGAKGWKKLPVTSLLPEGFRLK